MNPIVARDRGQSAVAEEWSDHRVRLADWAERELVVRPDRRGGYYVDGDGKTLPTMPWEPLDRGDLERHFAAQAASDVMGLLVISPDETCKWVVIDIDAHEGDGADPAANFRLALSVLGRARGAGLTALLFDSDGRGGHHIWILLGVAVPARDAFRLGKLLILDHAAFGVAKPPETFPKSPALTGKRFGNWVRLAGMHPKRPHWTRIWSPERGGWLQGEEAVEAILSFEGRAVNLEAVIPPEFTGLPPRAQKAPRRDGPRIGLPRVADRQAAARPSGRRRDVRLARAALEHLGEEFYEDHDRWILIGMCLRELGEDGLQLWDRWSGRSVTKFDRVDLESRWASFAEGIECGGVTLGSLFRMAREAGWGGPASDILDHSEDAIRPVRMSGSRGTISIAIRPLAPAIREEGS